MSLGYPQLGPFVRIVIHRRVSALSADQRTEDRRVRGHPNLEMGRAWLQLEGVAPTRVPCPISEGRIRGSGSDRSGSEHGEMREREKEQDMGLSKLIFELIIYDKICCLNT
jgi:hypothetical protein